MDNFSDEDIELDDVEGDVEVLRNLPLPQRGMLMRGAYRNEGTLVYRDPNYHSPNIPQTSRSVPRCRGEAVENEGEFLESADGNVEFDGQDVSSFVPDALVEPEELFEWPGDRPHPLLSSHVSCNCLKTSTVNFASSVF